MLNEFANHWWLVALRGVLAILFGLACFFWPGPTVLVLVLLFGSYALVDGVFAIVAAIRSPRGHEQWWGLLLEGVAGIIAGLVTVLVPAITALALLFVIAAWALITGVLEIAAAIRLRREISNEWLLALSGVASIIFGAILFLFPGAGALAVIWTIGAYEMVFGVLLVALGVRLRVLQQRTHGGYLHGAAPMGA